jgi:hypothetical protein
VALEARQKTAPAGAQAWRPKLLRRRDRPRLLGRGSKPGSDSMAGLGLCEWRAGRHFHRHWQRYQGGASRGYF